MCSCSEGVWKRVHECERDIRRTVKVHDTGTDASGEVRIV